MKYNVTENDGEQTSVMVFINGQAPLIATKEHPKFGEIIDTVSTPGALGSEPDVQTYVQTLFDQSIALAKHLDKVSDRVSVGSGRVFFDGDEVHDTLTAEILRFHSAGLDNFKPLVLFMEKIATNPLQHSREHLFNWLEGHKYALAPDGDFYAYKGLDGQGFSTHSGMAIVNGERHNGRIPNPDGAIVEMPRSKVQHNSSVACSTGLHVANFAFARGFGSVKLIKVNPRDVVSVPTDAGGDKMRVCRYYVVGPASSEDTSLLIRTAERTARTVGQADPNGKAVQGHATDAAPAAKVSVPVKRKPKKAAVKKAAVKLPTYYEQYSRDQFLSLPYEELVWLAGEWDVVKRGTKEAIVGRLLPVAKQRLKTWK